MALGGDEIAVTQDNQGVHHQVVSVLECTLPRGRLERSGPRAPFVVGGVDEQAEKIIPHESG